jgi:hypothetical protein
MVRAGLLAMVALKARGVHGVSLLAGEVVSRWQRADGASRAAAAIMNTTHSKRQPLSEQIWLPGQKFSAGRHHVHAGMIR